MSLPERLVGRNGNVIWDGEGSALPDPGTLVREIQSAGGVAGEEVFASNHKAYSSTMHIGTGPGGVDLTNAQTISVFANTVVGCWHGAATHEFHGDTQAKRTHRLVGNWRRYSAGTLSLRGLEPTHNARYSAHPFATPVSLSAGVTVPPQPFGFASDTHTRQTAPVPLFPLSLSQSVSAFKFIWGRMSVRLFLLYETVARVWWRGSSFLIS